MPVTLRYSTAVRILSWCRTIAACVFFLATAYGSEQPLVLDLPGAVAMTLQKNYRIAVDRFLLEEADWRLVEQRGIFDPTLEFEAIRSEQQSTLEDATTEAGNNDFYRGALTGLLPWGMRYDLGLQTRRLTDREQEDRYSSFAGLTLTQPLLRGFGPAPTLARIRVARIGQAVSEWELRQRIMDTVSETILVYNDLHFSRLNRDVAMRSRDLAARLLGDNERRSEIGVMSPLDVTEARADLASRTEAVILAEREVRDNENFLKRLVTDDLQALLDRPVVIAPVPMLAPPAMPVREGISYALANRPDYRRAMLELQQSEITLVLDRSEGLPRLDLKASYGANGVDDGFRQSLSRLTDEEETEWSVGAVFSMPIPNRAGIARVRLTKVQIARALIDLKRLEQDIIVEIDNAAGRIETARQRIAATRESRILSQERLRAETTRLQAGASTTFLVLESQRALAEAEAAELRAMVDYNKAVVEYERALGLTLERRGIVLTNAL